MEHDVAELVDKASADAAIREHYFGDQETYKPASLSGQVDVFFHYEMHAWVAVNVTTCEIQPLPAPQLAWTVYMEDEEATFVEVVKRKHAGKLLDAFTHFSFQLWKRSSDDL